MYLNAINLLDLTFLEHFTHQQKRRYSQVHMETYTKTDNIMGPRK